MVVAGTAAAVLGVGAGTASAAAVSTPAHEPAVVTSQQGAAAFRQAGTPVALLDAAVVKAAASLARPASHGAVYHVPAVHARTGRAAARHAAKPRNLPAADQLRPVPVYGPQQYMQLGPDQMANARTIVKQALVKKMGVRSAVIAVATAMQESMLSNINYGTSDSLGLFQQRPSCGWGTPQQIMHPVYASDAFLHALKTYQANNPGWASQPLYQAAQGVQGSAFPTAYAKWEAQAAGLVQQATTHLTR